MRLKTAWSPVQIRLRAFFLSFNPYLHLFSSYCIFCIHHCLGIRKKLDFLQNFPNSLVELYTHSEPCRIKLFLVFPVLFSLSFSDGVKILNFLIALFISSLVISSKTFLGIIHFGSKSILLTLPKAIRTVESTIIVLKPLLHLRFRQA